MRVAAEYLTLNVSAIAGSDGRCMFIAKAPTAERQIIVNILGGVDLSKNLIVELFVIPVRYCPSIEMSR